MNYDDQYVASPKVVRDFMAHTRGELEASEKRQRFAFDEFKKLYIKSLGHQNKKLNSLQEQMNHVMKDVHNIPIINKDKILKMFKLIEHKLNCDCECHNKSNKE